MKHPCHLAPTPFLCIIDFSKILFSRESSPIIAEHTHMYLRSAVNISPTERRRLLQEHAEACWRKPAFDHHLAALVNICS